LPLLVEVRRRPNACRPLRCPAAVLPPSCRCRGVSLWNAPAGGSVPARRSHAAGRSADDHSPGPAGHLGASREPRHPAPAPARGAGQL